MGLLAKYCTHPPKDHKWAPKQKYQDWNGLGRSHYSSLQHAFISFKFPIPTDKKLNITLLPRKAEKRCETELRLHLAINRLRFYSNSLIHILPLLNSHNNVASIQKNRDDKLHRVIIASLKGLFLG